MRPYLPHAALLFLGISSFTSVSWELLASDAEPPPESSQLLSELGKELFFDPNLSLNRTEACATCHNPEFAFTDPRLSLVGRAASIGDDGNSIGTRNTPTLMYARFAPPLAQRESGRFTGGLFWDGRADTLEEQASQPIFNPVEMNMPDAAAVAARLRENPSYINAFEALFGTGILEDEDRALDATASALAAYQRTEEFAPFDSKYDRYIRGEAELTAQEQFGRAVFLTWNCQTCHTAMHQRNPDLELFTSYDHHNIGVPAHPGLSSPSDAAADPDGPPRGTIRTPTLRNIAVTGPYMHNGSMEELETALRFYNKYLSEAERAQTNPETGEPWGPAEYPETISERDLASSIALSDSRIDALEAFLRTLTDSRYEHLLTEN